MRILRVIRIYAGFVGLASAAIFARNFYYLSKGIPIMIVPDPVNLLEMVLALIALPAFLYMIIQEIKDLSKSDPGGYPPRPFLPDRDRNI